MVDIDEVIERLEAYKPSIGQAGTDGAADYDAVRGMARVFPFLHVIPAQDRQARKDLGALPHVLLHPQFWITLSVRNVKDGTGRAGHAELRALRMKVWNVLLGWTPTGMQAPLELVSGHLVFMNNGVLQWTDIFQTRYSKVYELQ